MAAPKKGTKLATVHDTFCDTLLDALKGEPMLNKEGEPIIVNGQVLMRKPSAATLREVREALKDHGIDEELTEGSKILKVADAARKYEDADDPFLIPDTKQSPEKSTS
jgi:hypothetical protein